MITTEFADKLIERMQEHITSELSADELDTLSKILSSDVLLKAFGRVFAYCKLTQNQMTQLDMNAPGAMVEFCKAQGQILGIGQAVTELFNLVIEKEDEDDSA